jgi:hypothetical protein
VQPARDRKLEIKQSWQGKPESDWRHSPETRGKMETGKQCAYNQTRERFLGLNVASADFSGASLDDRISGLTPKSGAGLWMVPFRGISPSGVRVPLDLVYLNDACGVIDVVESFPASRVSPSSPAAASVLALPIHSIYATQTQPGDQVLVCDVEELERRLGRRPAASELENAGRSSAPWKEDAAASEGKQAGEERVRAKNGNWEPAQEDRLPGPVAQRVNASRSWLERWLLPDPPDPRKARREPWPGLAAYFWTGGVPQAHPIRDISSTGLYVVTDERWYPGTVIRMTLTKADQGEGIHPEQTISLHAKAVRWGNDGVGLQFVLANSREKRPRHDPLVDGLEDADIKRFLDRLQKDKGSVLFAAQQR